MIYSLCLIHCCENLNLLMEAQVHSGDEGGALPSAHADHISPPSGLRFGKLTGYVGVLRCEWVRLRICVRLLFSGF